MFAPRDFIDGCPMYKLKGQVPVPCKENDRQWDRDVHREVALDDLGHVRVSTIFIGSDRRAEDTARPSFSDFIAKKLIIVGQGPLLFETAVFKKGGGVAAIEMYRYSTWEEAALGHRSVIEAWRALRAGEEKE